MFVEISKEFSRKVFDDGREAIENCDHACHHMFCWQNNERVKPYQLPEPFSGRQSEYRLIFVGLNPSLTKNEEIPVNTAEWTFERYDAYYRGRFDHRDNEGRIVVQINNGKPKSPRLWRNIEKFGRSYISRGGTEFFRLGQHAILIEIVHYKSKGGYLGSNPEKKRLLKHQSCFTRKLLDEIAPCVLVAMGNAAVRQLFSVLKLSPEPKPQVRKLMGQTFPGQTPSGKEVLVVPMQHPSYPTTPTMRQAVAREICKAIDKISPSSRLQS